MVQWIGGAIVWIQLRYFELTRNHFLHDPTSERRMGVKTCRFLTSILKIKKLMVDVAQLTGIVIKALLNQSSNSLVSRSLFGGLG